VKLSVDTVTDKRILSEAGRALRPSAAIARSDAARILAKAGPRKPRKRPAQVDGRTILGKRVDELRALFTAEATRAGREMTPMLKLLVEQAASALALAELARGRYMSGDGDRLSDLATVERRADQALRRIGLPPDKPAAPPDDGPSFAEEVERKWGKSGPARVPTVAEVAAEQARRVVAPAVEAAAPMSGPGPDLGSLSDDELERLKVYLG